MIIPLTLEHKELAGQAADILLEAFLEKGIQTWNTREKALEEVTQCLDETYVCLGCLDGGDLLGWIGARPMYSTVTWELHPLAVKPGLQGKGIGTRLVQALEQCLQQQGADNIMLGTDDETGRTSLFGKDFTSEPLFKAIEEIRNISHHPYEFYQKLGYRITGVIPDASGKGKHDIWMWKRIRYK